MNTTTLEDLSPTEKKCDLSTDPAWESAAAPNPMGDTPLRAHCTHPNGSPTRHHFQLD